MRLLSRDPIERGRLVKALTIHVSEFFRNPRTFRSIQTEVLPAI
jgi:chemotaxis protein methyltransferase CheR